MTARRFVLIVALVLPLIAAAGCGDDNESATETTPNLETARPFTDGFMDRLVVNGRWQAIRPDVSPLIQREVRSFQRQLVKDHVRTVVGTGKVRNDCPPNPTLGTGSDCFLYNLAGKQVEPVSGKITLVRSQMHVWVGQDVNNRWEMQAYDYNAQVAKPGENSTNG